MKKEIIELTSEEQLKIIESLKEFEKKNKIIDITSFILNIFVSMLFYAIFKKLGDITGELFIMGVFYLMSLSLFILLVRIIQLRQRQKELQAIALDNEKIRKKIEELQER